MTMNLRTWCTPGILLLGLWVSHASVAQVACDAPSYDDPRVRVSLKRSWVGQGMIFGTFEVAVPAVGSGLTLGGRRSREGFLVDYPEVVTEFKDPNGGWTEADVQLCCSDSGRLGPSLLAEPTFGG